MAVVISHANFKPWKQRSRLRSFPHPDPNFSFDLFSKLEVNPPMPATSMPRRSFHRSLSTPCLSTKQSITLHQQDQNNASVEVIGSLRARGTESLIAETAIALASGALPIPASSGLGGAYFLRNKSSECFAVIKPIGEESMALGILGRPPGSRLVSVHASETGLREVAAYLLDHGGFSGVPPTALVKISKKLASIQRFVPHEFDAGDLGPSRFSIASVHRIGILDVRLLNIDRHAGNILVKKDGNDMKEAELVPIDHGLCLPELVEDPYFEWLHWPQAKVPFSEVESEYIMSLDPGKDAALLHSELPSLKEAAIRIMILCTVFLKKAAAEGLCLADIGAMMTREFCGIEEGPSVLESLCKRAEDSIRKHTCFFLDCCNGSDTDNENDFQFMMDDDENIVENTNNVKPKFIECDEDRKVNGHDYERDEPKLGSLAKSISMSAAEVKYESGMSSSSKCISFSKLSEEEWSLFLERFEQLLPEAFEERKNVGLNQRLGSSCKF